ncbi:MAG: hypothetical protein IJJ74_02920 [Eubacterium sp.]|nr:hypothetical protein [Eubacterium sp.]
MNPLKMFREFLENLKNILVDYLKSRIFPVTLIMIFLFALLGRRLFILQIKNGDSYQLDFTVSTEKTLTVDSVRGNIYDVNGKLLAYNKLTYDLTFANDEYTAARAEQLGISQNRMKNQVIYSIMNLLSQYNDKITAEFPIVYKNGKYYYTETGNSLLSFLRDAYSRNNINELTDEEKEISAEDMVYFMRFGGHDDIPNFEITTDYSNEDAMTILACRYSLWLNRYQQYVPVTIATDISADSRAVILEHKDELIGMDIIVRSERVYNDAKYFAQIIGYVGKISQEEIDYYNKDENIRPYKSTEVVGKTGIEQYCESYLRGEEGRQVLRVDNLGKVIDVISETPAKAGSDIYLTIDSDLQKYCYDTLEKEIANILLTNITPNAYAPENNKDNVIPITDVYFALFDNNQIKLSKMQESGASILEKSVYSTFSDKKTATLGHIRELLTTAPEINNSLSKEYQDYMEFIFEKLSDEGIYLAGNIDKESTEFNSYINGNLSAADFITYLLNNYDIDTSKIIDENKYYDSEEIYASLVDKIIELLRGDGEFDKKMLHVLIQEGYISGDDVVNLIYLQGVLPTENDEDYEAFKNDAFGSYEFITRKIRKLEITPAMLALDPCSGAVIVTDVHTGEVRAMVSYPSYDNNYLTNYVDGDYYNKLLNDKTTPLYNRASMMRTAPGSTFKVISTIAGVEEGVLDIDEEITDLGTFDKVFTQPTCWIYRSLRMTHGTIGIEEALDISCNYFYYEVGYRLADENGYYNDGMGLARLNKYAAKFGFDGTSGIEIDENDPHMSDNDAVTSAIGQGTNSYTPAQMAKYITTIANKGTCYDLTLIDKVKDLEGNIIKESEHNVHSTVEVSSRLWEKIYDGMRLVVTDDLSGNELLNSIKVSVSGKTGTAQEDTSRPAHALFVSFAPSEDPEVAVTCVIQNGYSSANSAELASFIYAYMYDKESLTDARFGQNTGATD